MMSFSNLKLPGFHQAVTVAAAAFFLAMAGGCAGVLVAPTPVALPETVECWSCQLLDGGHSRR